MHKLALSVVLTSQGISFLHVGTEFMRSKKGVENSYNSPDSINEIDWALKTVHKDMVDYVKGLIQMRKEHPAFRMRSAKQIVSNLRFETGSNIPPGMVCYTINGAAAGDKWRKIFVVFWGQSTPTTVKLPKGDWKYHVHNNILAGGENRGGG